MYEFKPGDYMLEIVEQGPKNANSMQSEPKTIIKFANFEKKHLIVIAKIRKFSREDIHTPGHPSDFIEYVIEDEYFNFLFLPKFYANGSNASNSGYISVHFCGKKEPFIFHKAINSFKLFFTVHVIDSCGEKRFLDFFTFTAELGNSKAQNEKLEEIFSGFGIDKYWPREKLLNNPLEILPNDCLTLHLEIDLEVNANAISTTYFLDTALNSSYEIVETNGSDGVQCRISLNSLAGKCLYKHSRVFKCMFDAPMAENRLGYVTFSIHDHKTLQNIFYVLFGENIVNIDSSEDIFAIYKFAHTYDIPFILKTCREWLKSILLVLGNAKCDVNDIIAKILHFAELFNDDKLRKIVKNCTDLDSDINTEELSMDEGEAVWKCNYKGYIFLSHSFEMIRRPEISDDTEHIYI